MEVAAGLARIRVTGPWSRAREIHERLARAVHEQGRIETSHPEPIEELSRHPDIKPLGPSRWNFLRRALRHCEIGPNDVFADVGSGKGRIVWQAAHYPFARVIGIEISERLNRHARLNINRDFDGLSCHNVDLITADATQLEFPDDVTFAYMYSPFTGDVFRQATNRMIESLDRRPRCLTVIYVNPEMDEDVRATGRFELARVLKGLRPDLGRTRWINIYRGR
jgi:Methyltransferase domain